ncbi:MAG TPA: IS4 family transposase, partial [Nitrospiraceae bacterium]|nr:IS4 family transposase [Nitrospiraceae bacterium]
DAGERKVTSFSCLDQFLCMAFAQLTFRERLRDIEACLRAQHSKLVPPRDSFDGRTQYARQCECGARLAHLRRLRAGLIAIARSLYVDEPFGVDLKESVYALATTTIDLCLSVFSWAPLRLTKAAVKLHTLLDLRGNIPAVIHISDGKMHEVNILDQLLPEPGAFYVMDRGFLAVERLYRFHEAGSFFVTRGKSNLKAHRRYSHPVDRATGLICDQPVVLTGFYSHKGFEAPLRRIRFKEPETDKPVIVLTTNFTLPAFTITELYRCRWHVELFFKWIKQPLRIKAFFGTSENAVKSQIWIAVSVYVLVAIVKKRLKLSATLYEMLQILSLTLCERMPWDQLLAQAVIEDTDPISDKQLILFE